MCYNLSKEGSMEELERVDEGSQAPDAVVEQVLTVSPREDAPKSRESWYRGLTVTGPDNAAPASFGDIVIDSD
jgi:hypothetical protein